MKVSSERPLLLYCESCGGLGKFRGSDNQEIAVHLAGSGWQVRPQADSGLSVVCPTCYVEDLRARAHAETERQVAGTVEDAPRDLIRARRVEIVNDAGQSVLTARAGTRGGKITLLDNSGSRVLVASAAELGGMLGLADTGGKLLWRAPCSGPGCKPNGH